MREFLRLYMIVMLLSILIFYLGIEYDNINYHHYDGCVDEPNVQWCSAHPFDIQILYEKMRIEEEQMNGQETAKLMKFTFNPGHQRIATGRREGNEQ